MTADEMIAAARNPDYRRHLQHLRSWHEIDGLLIGMVDEIERLRAALELYSADRDEVDRRAGAAERRLEDAMDSIRRRKQWLSKAKREWGVPDSVSFDEVWKEALALKRPLVSS